MKMLSLKLSLSHVSHVIITLQPSLRRISKRLVDFIRRGHVDISAKGVFGVNLTPKMNVCFQIDVIEEGRWEYEASQWIIFTKLKF